MTRGIDKKALTNGLFPDWRRLLAQAARVETAPNRRCYFCGSRQAEMVRMQTMDEWRCEDIENGCGRRLVKRG